MPKHPDAFKTVMTAVRRQLPAVFVLSCFVNILLLVTAIYMLQIYDRVLSSGSLDTLVWLSVIAIFAIIIYGILEQSRRMMLSRAAMYVERELNSTVLQKTMERRLAGEELVAGVRDVTDLRSFYQSDAMLAFLDAPWSAVFIIFIWNLHPALGLVACFGAATLFFAALVNDLLTRPRQRDAAANARATNEAAIRYVNGGETIAPLGMAKAIFARWRAGQAVVRDSQQGLQELTSKILSFSRSVRMGLQMAILGTGAYFVLAGELTAGGMVAASIILGRALAPIERSTAAWSKFVAARNAKRNLGQLFKQVQAEVPHVELPRPQGELRIENLSYRAPKSVEPILQGIDFGLEPGTACAVIGPSGAGKSTLCRLLVGAWKPTIGHVRLDGADVFSWESVDLGKYIGYLPQKVELFPGTIAENIARFREGDDAAVIAAANLAGVHKMILGFPAGYETVVETSTDHLSQGQRQRIGLARALYGDPSLVVLDEPNSNLDDLGDKALFQAITRLKELGRTIVIVSHRAEILKVVDKVLLLRDGTMAKFGDRDDFLRPVEEAPVAPPARVPLRRVQNVKATDGSGDLHGTKG